MLLYAVGIDHPFREPCLSLMDAVEDGGIEATTTPEVIQEFTHVRARNRDRPDALALARDYIELFAPLLVVEEHQLSDGLQLFEQHPRLGAFDAVLAATARATNADALVSADAAFAEVPRLAHVVPEHAALDPLLG